MKYILSLVLLTALISFRVPSGNEVGITTEAVSWLDSSRNRIIPAQLYYNKTDSAGNHRLVIISAGYLGLNTEYSFLANHLAQDGYRVAVLSHELPSDEPIAREGNLYELRMPNWERGVKNVQYAVKAMKRRFPGGDINKLIL
ncbi:MAG TPA: alpha/beta hydrolase, partial [Bacteroidia bacterium]|nr:alpha/beta hydrolase [Bacteroidia bacterium]